MVFVDLLSQDRARSWRLTAIYLYYHASFSEHQYLMQGGVRVKRIPKRFW